MATKHVTDFPSPPTNDESDGEDQDSAEASPTKSDGPKVASCVQELLKRLQSTGALVKTKQEHRCFTCEIDFPRWKDLEKHLIQHVSLPSVVIDKLPSDDEYSPPSGDENWSDEEEEPPPPAKTTPQKLPSNISQILKNTGITLKKKDTNTNSESALNKLSGLGFTIKKGGTPIKQEPEESAATSTPKINPGLKLKLKSSGNNGNSFRVINGLKDFKASDDEDEGSGNEDSKDNDEEQNKSGEQEGSTEENSSDEKNDSKGQDSDDCDGIDEKAIVEAKIANACKRLQGKIIAKTENPTIPKKVGPLQIKPSGRPVIKQTPKRSDNVPSLARIQRQPSAESVTSTPTSTRTPTPTKRPSQEQVMENVKIKQEVETPEQQPPSLPIFTGQIKTERGASPIDRSSCITPVIPVVKDDPDAAASKPSQPIFSNSTTAPRTTMPLLPVTKIEDTSTTIIEINGDSNDEDDDCCVVSTTPAPDIKPIVPKIENPPIVSCPPISQSYSSSQPSYSSSGHISPRITTAPSLEKQHNFNWNAPDSKPMHLSGILDNTADDIFQSLISNSAKKENLSLSDASEYVSLDTLGPQHTCDVCNTRFTDLSLLENHRRVTGHSSSLVAPSSSTLMPYNPNSSILSSLLPVKQLADQVGKLSTIGGSGPGFTHQQNVMINIQAYPGSTGVMGQAPTPYNTYQSAQNMGPSYQQAPNSMYGTPPQQQMPGQYPGQNTYMGQQGYGQFPSSMPNSTYPGTKTENVYSAASSQYSTTSPLQSMQQAVYGQSPGLMNVPGQMGPPGSMPYIPSSSPSTIKTAHGNTVKIQNVQTFPPNQMMGMPGQQPPGSTEMPPPPQPQQGAPGQVINQMPPPGQIRMAPGAQIGNMRPRMPTVRGQRPTIRPGIHVHGQVRGAKPNTRMPLKRPGNMGQGPNMKKRPNMLLPDKHDNEDCQVMAMQKQREGLPMIHSVQGARDKIGSQISITKKTVNKEANAMANVLASRGISIKQKQKSRSPTPERPIPHFPNLGAGVSIKHTSKASSFSIPEAKVGGGMLSCKVCKKMFMNHNSLAVHMNNAHPQNKLPVFKCDECPSSYPKLLQLQHHKRVFHNVTGPNRELGIPVVDLSQEDNLKRLSNLGIYSFIPLANREQDNGCFGIPVVSVHNMQNGLTSSLQALGADGLLSLGPLKPLPNA